MHQGRTDGGCATINIQWGVCPHPLICLLIPLRLLWDCSDPTRELFLSCCLLTCFPRAFLLPTCVPSSSWTLCFLRSNRLLWCCPFDLMRETPTTMMCMCFFPYYLAGGLDIHISPRILLFLWVLASCPCSLSLARFSVLALHLHHFCCFSPCPPCLLWLLFSKGKPFTHSEGSNDLSLTSQMLTKFLIILCLSTAGAQPRVSDFRHKSLAFSQAGWTPGSLLKHH